MTRLVLLLSAAALVLTTLPAWAGDCTGFVVNVRPTSQYDHAAGSGFLAVRAGPGSNYRQVSEFYLGDEIAVWGRQGNWYQAMCMSGHCESPFWGEANSAGWVYGKYIDIGGVCP